MESYKKWVRKNREFVQSLESMANGITWLLPERFSNSEIGPEAVYAFLGVISTVNQHIIDTIPSHGGPRSSGQSSSSWPLCVSVLKDLETVVEVASQHFLGDDGKWNFIALTEATKVLVRLAQFKDSGYRILLQGGETSNSDKTSNVSDTDPAGMGNPGRIGCVIELGGTVGDIESMPFIEALRQLSFSIGKDNFCLIHVSLIPVLGVVGEQKTKPTQHSVRELRALGLTSDLLVCRSAQPLREGTKEKLSQFCHVPAGNILNIHDVPNIWHVPLLLRNQNAHDAILKQLDCVSIAITPNLEKWTNMAETYDNLTGCVKVALVGKYTGLSDSYLSVVKALLHACIAYSLKPSVEWIAASDLEDESAKLAPEAHCSAWDNLKNSDCVLVPGGFGDRGVPGMILAAKYARENRIPYLGICLGMQISVIELSRSVLGMERANSTEFDAETPEPVVIFMPEGSRTYMGSTMRLGCRRTFFQTPDCISSKLYRNSSYVDERHRHRYEVNPDVIGKLEGAGLQFVGRDESGKRMEILELPDHPYYVGVQFHPEYKSRPGRPSPLFVGLILAASGRFQEHLSQLGKSEPQVP